MKNLIAICIALVLAVAFAVVPVSAAAGYAFDTIEINGIASSKDISVERGQAVNIKAEVYGLEDTQDVRFKAWIDGYDDEIRAVSDIFDVEKGYTQIKALTLELPSDMDATQTYTLHLELSGEDDSTEVEYPLRIREGVHLLNIVDAIPSATNLEAGDYFYTTVRVENMGARIEENIRVTVSVPELGISQRAYIDELSPEDADEEEDSASSDAILLQIPKGTKAGEYKANVEVAYNHNRNTVTSTFQLKVGASSATDVMVSADTETMKIVAGEGAVYEVTIANLGKEDKTFTAEVAGVDAFGKASVDPSKVTVKAGEEGQMFVYVTANQDAAGEKAFTVKILDGEDVVSELNLKANVEGKTSAWDSIKTGLEIGFVVLLIILVIVGLIMAINKMRGDDEDLEEPSASDAQTYY